MLSPFSINMDKTSLYKIVPVLVIGFGCFFFPVNSIIGLVSCPQRDPRYGINL